jgi:hypothetical protein
MMAAAGAPEGDVPTGARPPKEKSMPRMLRRAAVLGATAHVASNRGQAKAEAAQQQQAAAAPSIPAQVAPPEPAQPVAEPASPTDSYADLMKLKELLDAGALTQAEFDAEKQKILSA